MTLAASSGWPADGFEVTRSTTMTQSFGYLALKGSFNKALAERTTLTAGTPPVDDDYDVGFSNQKVALMFGGNHGLAADTAPRLADTDGYQWWVSACDINANQWVSSAMQEDSAADSDTYCHRVNGRALRFCNADTGVQFMDAIGSFSGTNLRLAYQAVNATARGYGALVLGWDAEPTGPAFPLPGRAHRGLVMRGGRR